MKEILDVIHNTIYQFFDVCGDDEETPMSDKDKLLLEVNKAICNNLKALEEPCDGVVLIPKNATNGDMIQAMFPNIKIHEHEKTDICDAYIQIDIWDFSIYVSKEWCNAPYKNE